LRLLVARSGSLRIPRDQKEERVGLLKTLLLMVASMAVILPLTRFSLTMFAVPEEEELFAGIFLTLTYGLLGSPILALLAR
jgi:hypothetical protein